MFVCFLRKNSFMLNCFFCDTGAYGLLCFFEGMLEAIDGKPLEDGFSSKNDKSKTLLLQLIKKLLKQPNQQMHDTLLNNYQMV